MIIIIAQVTGLINERQIKEVMITQDIAPGIISSALFVNILFLILVWLNQVIKNRLPAVKFQLINVFVT